MKRILLAPGLLALAWANPAYGQAGPTVTSVVDPYTGGVKLCPGGLATINGTEFGVAPQVTVGGKTAYTVTPPVTSGGTQMTIEIPVDAPIGAGNVIVTLGTGASATFPITLTQYAPVLISSTSGTLVSPAHQAPLSSLPVTVALPAHAGETVTFYAIGLGPTTPLIPTGTPAPNNVTLTTPPSLTINGGSPIQGVTTTAAAGQIGIYQIAVTIPTAEASGNYPVVISVGGTTGNTVTLNVGSSPSGPTVVSVVDAVTSNTALCPGDLAAINGVNLGNSPQVTVGGKTAYNVVNPNGGNQMIVQIPVDAPLGGTNLVVTLGTGQSATFPITLVPYAPVLIGSGAGSVSPPVHQKSGAPVTAANPAQIGETIAITAIGLGPTSPQAATGVAPSSVPTAATPTVKLNGSSPGSPASAALLTGQAGVYQVTFSVPSSAPTGNPFLSLSIGGAASNTINLPIAAAPTGPVIASLQNNYSNIVPGLPNYGIAQGSIFDIFGVNLANTSTGLQSLPLSTSLQNVSVSVIVNGVTTEAILYYVTPGQIGAILPSATPVGDGAITVSNNGQISPAAPIHVVQSAFGILTLNGAGYGPAAAFDVNSNYLGFTNALNPGDYFILWGTGAGPSSGDETVTQIPTNLTNVPFSIEIGGLPAQVYYHGRSQYPGLDQVIGIVPAGIQPGCWVDVVTRSGNIVSNFATLPVAASGRTCSDAGTGVTASQLQSVLGLSSFNVGSLEFDNDISPSGAGSSGNSVTDAATAQFFRITPAAFGAATLGPSIGSCFAVGYSAGNPPSGFVVTAPLNAGPVVNLGGPNGSAQLTYQSGSGKYGGNIGGTGTTQPAFLTQTGGTVTFSNGTGGPDVGAFTASTTLATPVLSWSQYPAISSVSRISGITVSWTSPDPNSFIQISGVSVSSGPSSVGAQFVCSVPSAAGQFAIPASILLSLPASDTSAAASGYSMLQVSQETLPQPFAATGLNLGFIKMVVQYTAPVLYQ